MGPTMRALVILAALAAATPAAAQLSPADQGRILDLEMQQEMMRQRGVALQNELTTLEARLRTEQSLATLELQSRRPLIPLPPAFAGVPPTYAPIDSSKLVSIPDDRLAASNAAVRQATQRRR